MLVDLYRINLEKAQEEETEYKAETYTQIFFDEDNEHFFIHIRTADLQLNKAELIGFIFASHFFASLLSKEYRTSIKLPRDFVEDDLRRIMFVAPKGKYPPRAWAITTYYNFPWLDDFGNLITGFPNVDIALSTRKRGKYLLRMGTDKLLFDSMDIFSGIKTFYDMTGIPEFYGNVTDNVTGKAINFKIDGKIHRSVNNDMFSPWIPGKEPVPPPDVYYEEPRERSVEWE